MKCKKCGATIPDGKLYCPKCGTPVQVVPDYNMLDDDMLSSMVSEDEKKAEKEKLKSRVNRRFSGGKKMMIFGIAVVLCVAGLALGIYFTSYSFYMTAGKRAYQRKNYTTAENYFTRADQRMKHKDSDALYFLGMARARNKDKKGAEDSLEQALKLNPDSRRTVTALLKLYYAADENDKIEALKDTVTSESLLELVEEYSIGTVKFSAKGGSYDDDLTLRLSSDKKETIYYTLNGRDPTIKTAHKYSEPLHIVDGTTRVKAVCVNDDGKAGDVTEEIFRVTYKEPSDPVCEPEGGTYTVPTAIKITADKNCKIYYTWDGSEPNSSSNEYTSPIQMEEGNNVLSVIAVNSHDMTSRIVKVNYIYEPDFEEPSDPNAN